MAAVTITVVDKYLLTVFNIVGVATRYWAVVKSNYMLEHPKQYEYHNGNNLISLDNQQERLVNKIPQDCLNWYISGFVDGEGSFCLIVRNRKNVKYGFRIDPAFYVYQHEKNLWILKLIQRSLGYGSIHRKTSPYNVYTLQIAGIKPCKEYVLPFFQKYKLLVKSKTFKIFTNAVNMMSKKEHLNKKGMLQLLDYAYEINQLGKGRKWEKEIFVTRILRD